MPEISSFYGIVIYMYFNEHNPPHFHVKYADFNAIVTIEDGIVTGSLPRRALNLSMTGLIFTRMNLWRIGVDLRTVKVS